MSVSNKAPWTSDQKIGLLLNIVRDHGWKLSMDGVELPENRTKKACIHVIAAWNKVMRESKAAGAGGAGATAKRGKKRKVIEDEDDDEVDTKDGDKASGRSPANPAKKIKTEAGDDDQVEVMSQ